MNVTARLWGGQYTDSAWAPVNIGAIVSELGLFFFLELLAAFIATPNATTAASGAQLIPLRDRHLIGPGGHLPARLGPGCSRRQAPCVDGATGRVRIEHHQTGGRPWPYEQVW